MGQSLVKQYTHIIFSTKHQQPLIIDSIEEELIEVSVLAGAGGAPVGGEVVVDLSALSPQEKVTIP
jgi:hypothetical protein